MAQAHPDFKKLQSVATIHQGGTMLCDAKIDMVSDDAVTLIIPGSCTIDERFYVVGFFDGTAHHPGGASRSKSHTFDHFTKNSHN